MIFWSWHDSCKKKILVWGVKEDYESTYNLLQYEVLKGNIEIVALCCRKHDITQKTLDGLQLISKEELCNFDFEYIVIANPIGYMSILNDAEQIIRDRKVKVLSSEIFKLPRFDFNEYIESNVNLKAMISNFDILSKYEVET